MDDERFKKRLLDECLVYDSSGIKLASGLVSNVKFEFDRVADDSELFGLVIAALAKCIRANHDSSDYNAIMTVATGANRIGDPLAEELRAFHVPSRKDADGKFYIPEHIQDGTGAILVDDVFTTGSSFNKVSKEFYKRVYSHQTSNQVEFGSRIISAVALLDRSGIEEPVLTDGTRVYSVIRATLGTTD